jgi:hypothetical protein
MVTFEDSVQPMLNRNLGAESTLPKSQAALVLQELERFSPYRESAGETLLKNISLH